MRRLDLARPTTTTTRADVLAAADRLRRAAILLERHAARCVEPTAPAHAAALRQAQGMVRAVVDTGERDGVE